jgi:hypothetical protein
MHDFLAVALKTHTLGNESRTLASRLLFITHSSGTSGSICTGFIIPSQVRYSPCYWSCARERCPVRLVEASKYERASGQHLISWLATGSMPKTQPWRAAPVGDQRARTKDHTSSRGSKKKCSTFLRGVSQTRTSQEGMTWLHMSDGGKHCVSALTRDLIVVDCPEGHSLSLKLL